MRVNFLPFSAILKKAFWRVLGNYVHILHIMGTTNLIG